MGLEVNAEKSKYMVISRDQNARGSHNIKIDNSSFVFYSLIVFQKSILKGGTVHIFGNNINLLAPEFYI